MALERCANRTLILAGTRSLPGDFPEVGRLAFKKRDIEFDRTNEEVAVVEIEKTFSPTHARILTVLRGKVRGVFELKDKNRIEELDGKWILGPDVADVKDGYVTWGIVYVDRSAEIVVNDEYSCRVDDLDGDERMARPMSRGIPCNC